MQDLMDAGRPANFDVGGGSGAKSKMEAFVVRRQIAAGGGGEADLAIHLNASAEAIAIAAFSTQRDGEPVQIAAAVQEQLGMFAKRGGDHVDPAIVVQIAEGGAASGDGTSEPGLPFSKCPL